MADYEIPSGGADEEVNVFENGVQVGTVARALDFRDANIWAISEDVPNDEFDLAFNINVANGIVQLDGSADVPLAQIPDVLTNKSAEIIVRDEGGADFTPRPRLNFIGAGVTAVDDAGSDEVDITIAGGGSGVAVEEEDVLVVATATTLDFGIGFDITEAPANEANISLDLNEAFNTNVNLGANNLFTTNLILKEGNSNTFFMRNATDLAFINLSANAYNYNSLVPISATSSIIRTQNINDSLVTFQARDNDVGLAEVMRLQGGATPTVDFKDDALRIENPAATFHYSIIAAAITADRTLNLPLITGTDTLVTLTLAQTFTSLITFNAGWTASALSTINVGTTPADALDITIAQPGVAGTRDSHNIIITGTSFDASGHDADWRIFVDVTSNAGNSSLRFQERIDAASFVSVMSLNHDGSIDLAGGPVNLNNGALLNVARITMRDEIEGTDASYSIRPQAADDAVVLFEARINGGAFTEVGRLESAATPTLDLLAGRLTGSFNANSQNITAAVLITPTIASFVNATHDHLAAAGGGTLAFTETISIPIAILNAQFDANAGNTFPDVLDIGTPNNVHIWTSLQDVDGKIYARIHVPSNLAASPAAKIILRIMANATSGITRISVTHTDVNNGENFNVAVTESIAAIDTTVPGTAFEAEDITFTLSTQPSADDTMDIEIFHEGANANDTLAADTLLVSARLEVVVDTVG